MVTQEFVIYSIFYLLPVLGVAAIATVVAIRFRGRNKEFVGFSILLAFWLLMQYMAQFTFRQKELSLFFLHTAVALSTPTICIALVAFAYKYVGQKLGKFARACMGLSVLIMPFAYTGLSITSAEITEYGIAISVGYMYYLQLVLILTMATVVVYKLTRDIKTHSAEIQRKQRTKYLIFAFAQMVVINVVAGQIFASSQESQVIVPVTCLVMVVIVAYAIVKHKLFDIRLIVVRSLGYLFSLSVLVALYSVIVFGLFDRLGGANTSRATQQIFYLFAAVVLGLLLPVTKRFFDKVTRRLFYRDAYEAQELLNEFNEALVSTIDLGLLLENASGVITKYLKPEFCNFVLTQGKDKELRIVGHTQGKISQELLASARSKMTNYSQKVFITDALEDQDSELKSLIQNANIGAVVRISKSDKDEGLGYMLLGYKKSGNTYNSQDTEVMEILANELAIAIQNALQYEEIQNFAATLQTKVTEATSDLRKANEKLKKLDQTKDDFISMASHQLRTPLTSVKGYVSMVLEGDAGKINEQQKKLLDQSFISAQRMVYLIADLLNVSRLKTGKFVIDAKPTNLADVVEGEIAQLTETAKGRDLTLTFKKPSNFPTLMLDDTKIRQVIMNFADNAIYYTPAGGHINVALEDKGDTIEFTVTDDGIGVPKSEIHNLFNKFYRAGNAKKARPDGTGLGLFMAKKVIIAQGGSVIFKTEEGKGSTFGFSFAKAPLDPQHYQPPAPISFDDEKQDDTPAPSPILTLDKPSTSPAEAPGKVEQPKSATPVEPKKPAKASN